MDFIDVDKNMARKVDVIVETGKDLYSCFMSGADDLRFGLFGDGRTAHKAIDSFKAAYEEMKGYYAGQGWDFPELEFNFILDVGAFFSYYPINVTAFADYVGMNASQLRQYACGLRTPTKKNIERIRQGIEQVTKDILAGRLIDRPVLQY